MFAHQGARHLATVIAEIEQGADAEWLKQSYSDLFRQRIAAYAHFAEVMYAANGCMSDVQKEREGAAAKAGVPDEPADIVEWLGQFGFSNDVADDVGSANHQLGAVKQMLQIMLRKNSVWDVNNFYEYRLRLNGAEVEERPFPQEGKMHKIRTYVRDGRRLPSIGVTKILIQTLQVEPRIDKVMSMLGRAFTGDRHFSSPQEGLFRTLSVLEAMLQQGWVVGKADKKKPNVDIRTFDETELLHWNREETADA
jgi:hypothetical protein